MAMRDWHLQIAPPREWVVWWYGPREDGGGHIEPANLAIHLGDPIGTLDIAFELPEHREGSGLQSPQEIRRVTSWGWRARSNSGTTDGGWHLAESREACVTDAQAWEARSMKQQKLQFTQDVREYFGGLW